MLKRLLLILLLSIIPTFAQQGNVVMIVFPGVPSGTCSSTMVALDVSTGDLYSCNGSAWLKVGPGAAGAVTWNSVNNPDGNQSLTMAAFTTTFTWGATTGAGVDMFSLLDTTGNTGTGYVLSVSTTGTSAAKPIRITDGGTANGVEMTTAGVFQAIGTGSILADDLVAGTIDALTDFAAALCGTNEILEDQGASWACIATPSGGGGAWSDLTDPTAVTVFNSGAIAELFQLNYTANYGATDVLFDVKQLTGNPLAGSILAQFTVNDPDMLPFAISDGTNTVFQVQRDADVIMRNFRDQTLLLDFDSGNVSPQIISFRFRDRTSTRYAFVKTAGDNFNIQDAAAVIRFEFLQTSNNVYRTGSATSSHSFANSAGTKQFFVFGNLPKTAWGPLFDVALERISDPNTVLSLVMSDGSTFGLPVIAADPNTTGWGTGQDGRIFFQSTANVPRIWDGAAIKEFSLLGQTISGSEMVNDTVTSTQLDETDNYTWTGQHDFDTAEILSAIPIRFEGLTDDNIYTTITITDPTVGRTFTLPNADSNSVQPLTCTGDDKVSAISSLGVVTCSTDQTAGGANWEAITNLANTATLYTGDNNAETFTINWTSNWATDRFTVSQGAGNPTAGALVTISYSDTDITAFVINDGTDTIAVDSGSMNALTMFPTGAAEIHATEVLINVQKGSAGTITAGQVVHQSGFDAVDNVIEVELADADAGATMPAIGVAQQSITDTSSGHIVAFGTLVGIDTSAFSVGDDLYVSGTAGDLTATKPTGTALIQKVAQVGRSHVSLGVIEVFGAGRSNDLPNIANDNIWIGDGTGVPVASIITDCVDTGGNHLNYTQSTNAFACGTSVLATTVLTDQSNTYSTGDQSFASASSLTVPTAAGAAPTSSGDIRYDTTSFTLEYGDNGTNRLVANLNEAQTLSTKTLDSTNIIQAGAYDAASIDGDDINSNLAGSGLVLTAAAPDILDIDLIDVVDSLGSASNDSGLEFGGTGGTDLGLLRGCDATNDVLKWENTTSKWGCKPDDDTGGAPRWDQLTDPTAVMSMTSGAVAEIMTWSYEANYTTESMFLLRTQTGTPSGGTLLDVRSHDADVTVATFGDGTNGVTINQEGDLTVALGTITLDNQAFDSTATWNAGGVTFTHLKSNVTDTASAAGSLLLDLQVGGTSQFKVDKAGVVTAGSSTAGGVSQLGGASDTGASAWEIFGGDGASNIEPAYLHLHQSATGEDAFLFPCDTDGAMCLSGSTPAADSLNVIMTLVTVESPTNKTLEAGIATTTHAANANFLQGLRHATDCTAITDGKDGEVCWEQDANTFHVCENGAGCAVPGDWAALAAASAAWDTLTDPSGAVTMNSNANAELVQFNYTSALGATDVAFQIEQLTGNPLAGSILLELVAADTDILLLSAGTGANTIDITQAGAMAAQGTATITATDLAADSIDALTEFAASLCAASQILERQASVWACIATPAGGTVRWDELTDPTGAIALNSNANTELFQMNFTSALGATDVAVQIEQLTGNPLAGSILLELVAADADILLLSAGTGANTIDITQTGAMSPQGTATITASDVLSSAGASPTASGKIAYDTTSDTLEFGENGTNRLVATRNADNNYSVNQTYAGGVDILLNNGATTNSTAIIRGIQSLTGAAGSSGDLRMKPSQSTGIIQFDTSAAAKRAEFNPNITFFSLTNPGSPQWYGLELTSDAAIAVGDVVKVSATTDDRVITATTTGDDENFVGIAQEVAGAAGTVIKIATGGIITNVVNDGGCTRGDFAKVSATTAGRIECTTTFDQAMIGMVTASATTGNPTDVLILPRSGSTGGAPTLDTIAAAAGTATINSGDNAIVWNWSLTTASKIAFQFGENVASTATTDPVLVDIATLSGSTAHPLEVTARGTANGIRVGATDGIVVAMGTGGLDWPALLNYPTGCTNQFVRTIADTLTCETVVSADVDETTFTAVTWLAGTNSTWAFDTTGGTSPVISFTGSNIDISTGALQVAGNLVVDLLDVPNAAGDISGDYSAGLTIDAGAVASTELATANKTFTKSIVIIDPTTSEDDLVQWMHGSAVTYTSVNCSTDTGTATIDMDHRVLTTPNTVGTDILTGTIVCDTDNQADGGFADATIPANVPVNLSITATASTPGTVRIHITYTKD